MKPKKFKQTKIGKIPEDWDVVKAKEYVNFVKGTEPGSKSYNKNGEGVRFLRVNDITEKREDVIFTLSKDVTLVNKKDILLSLDGTPGIVARGFKGAISSGIRKIIVKTEFNNILDYNFLYYVLQSNYIQRTIRIYSFGDIIKHASKSIDHLILPLPPLPEQKAIAKVLSTVDDAIEK
ncbi:MAG: restriction endonuclease subunit S, partial [Nanoarchaeota archaeon]|nr:restriction endonuclease subunit S [Nanoarchaeota archaeon]